MTLIECAISVAVSGLLLAGMMQMVDVAVASYETDSNSHSMRYRAEIVMNRLLWAMETADRMKRASLSNTSSDTSGDWFDRTDNGSKVVLNYKWDNGNYVLREKYKHSGTNEETDTILLNNVTNFSVTSPLDTEWAVVTVSMTIGNAITLTETRRLGGPW